VCGWKQWQQSLERLVYAYSRRAWVHLQYRATTTTTSSSPSAEPDMNALWVNAVWVCKLTTFCVVLCVCAVTAVMGDALEAADVIGGNLSPPPSPLRPLSFSFFLSPSCSLALSLAGSFAYAHAHTHAHNYTHTHTLSLSLSPSPSP